MLDYDDVGQAFETAIYAFLISRGLNPTDPDFIDTPARVLRALTEFTAGYEDDPAVHLSRTFPVTRSDEMIIVRDVPFTSLCAHHMLPFSGTAVIAYLPKHGARAVGLSKLGRVLDVYARRLQTQETLTVQVTNALDECLETLGSACIIRAEHGCLSYRGARKPGTVMITSSYTGLFQADTQLRSELHTHV